MEEVAGRELGIMGCLSLTLTTDF